MNNLRRVKLGSFFTQSVAGEWGSEPTGIDDVTVYRAADFSKDCKLNVTEGALRSVPKSKLSNRKLNRNDILVEKSGGSPTQPVGRAVIYKPESDEQVATCSNFLQRLVVDEEYSPEFVYYLMLGLYQANATLPYQQQTTGIYNLKLEEYLQTEVDTYVDRNLQEKVADILSTIDNQIDATQALIDKYTAIKQGMMADLFSRGIDPATKALRPAFEEAPELYHETPLGMLPKGWDVEVLGDLASIASGITLGKDLSGVRTVLVPYLRVANVQDGYLDLSEVKSIAVPEVDADKYVLQYGDVLMNEGGDFDKLGRGTVWREEIPGCCHQNHVFRVRADNRKLRFDYLAYWSASSFGKHYFVLNSKQSTNLASINSTQLKAFPVAKPTLEEQEEIESRLQSVDGLLRSSKDELHKLIAQKSGLMQDLLTGKVPVPA
ncbi:MULTISPECIES: restriction endonuclease subunit S [Vibrio]|uniref:restriction endonuclease subunit S n=1 Tax=Vibrio TaxID=662 RepID=UPI0011DC41BD|nr:restriction endonuclease subunit S [Vibrio mimicus]TXY47523.1 restriction endonuclease subunit S [Vibrio mimicus]